MSCIHTLSYGVSPSNEDENIESTVGCTLDKNWSLNF